MRDLGRVYARTCPAQVVRSVEEGDGYMVECNEGAAG